ncbi:MAG: hypothetical protein FJ044_04700, partial [Candidatus Cloacimonetes bacterium]|nr:hypothetical protein [Candidatus Cloacimonadota bacterium]
LGKESIYVTVSRLEKEGVLERLKTGIYVLADQEIDLTVTANQLYYPSYLSFETALGNFGIISQKTYTLTFATTRKSKKDLLGQTEVEYRHLNKDLFFGYSFKQNLYIAEPEKALLDELYMVSLGKSKLDFSELDLHELSFKKSEKMAQKFPPIVQKKLLLLQPRWKEIPIGVK